MHATIFTLLALSASTAFAQTVCKNGAPQGLDANNLPNQTETGQTGYNICGTQDSQTSMCQTAWINSVDDFCIWAPPTPNLTIGETERTVVAWCTKRGHGARLIPDGVLTGAHMVTTPDYVQITGTGDLSKINIQPGDDGGELDPHGADGCGNPIGGIVFSNAFGQKNQQIAEWTNFMDVKKFCFRICIGDKATTNCQHIYDIMGCFWNMPGNYNPGFDTCKGDNTEPMGVYGASTWYQGQSPTPTAHTPGATSQCVATSTVSNGFSISTSSSSAPTSTPTSNSTITSNSTSKSNPTSTTNSSSSLAKSGSSLSVKFDFIMPTFFTLLAAIIGVLLY